MVTSFIVQLNVHDAKKCPVAKLADKSYSQRDKIASKLKVLYNKMHHIAANKSKRVNDLL